MRVCGVPALHQATGNDKLGETATELQAEMARNLAGTGKPAAGATKTHAQKGTGNDASTGAGKGAMQKRELLVYRAKYMYVSRREDELSFKEGDIITIETKRAGKSWWYGRLDRDPAQAGMVPVT